MTTEAVTKQLWRMIVDEDHCLGVGIARTVYPLHNAPDWVCKVEAGGLSFQNVLEWETWRLVRDKSHAKWFAPCLRISPDGTILIQRRTRPPAPQEFPDSMPGFLDDFKRTNYGMLGRQIVCHDYGLLGVTSYGLSKRMRRVKWWDLKDRQEKS